MKTKVIYFFKSKHLGNAFMNELIDMGYVDNGNPLSDRHNCIITNFRKGNSRSVGFSTSGDEEKTRSEARKIFHLDDHWKDALKFAEVVEYLEGVWYYHPESGALARFTGSSKPYPTGRGFDLLHNWGHAINMSQPDQWEIADEERVIDMMIKEGKRRGYDVHRFEDLFTIKPNVGDRSIESRIGSWFYDIENDTLWFNSNLCYWNGKWAKIPEPLTFFDWDVQAEESRFIIAPDCQDAYVIPYEGAKKTVSLLKVFERNRTGGTSISDFINEAEELLKAIEK